MLHKYVIYQKSYNIGVWPECHIEVPEIILEVSEVDFDQKSSFWTLVRFDEEVPGRGQVGSRLDHIFPIVHYLEHLGPGRRSLGRSLKYDEITHS